MNYIEELRPKHLEYASKMQFSPVCELLLIRRESERLLILAVLFLFA